jgi:hypothetical protein
MPEVRSWVLSIAQKQNSEKLHPAPPSLTKYKAVVFRYRLRAGGVAQVVEDLPSKYEALSSNPNTDRKKKKDRHKLSQRPLEVFLGPVKSVELRK